MHMSRRTLQRGPCLEVLWTLPKLRSHCPVHLTRTHQRWRTQVQGTSGSTRRDALASRMHGLAKRPRGRRGTAVCCRTEWFCHLLTKAWERASFPKRAVQCLQRVAISPVTVCVLDARLSATLSLEHLARNRALACCCRARVITPCHACHAVDDGSLACLRRHNKPPHCWMCVV